jgi:superfamily II DNA or RNA helicase
LPVELTLVENGDSVEVRLNDAAGGAVSELEYALLVNGGTLTSSGYRLPSYAFRRLGVEFAALLGRLPERPMLSTGVEGLLRLQLSEIQARRAAESGVARLADDQVNRLLAESSRWNRTMTPEQMRNVSYLLALPHGANFSVPGAGKTTTLLAVYEGARARDEVERLLVVAPKNAFLAWDDEVAACLGGEGDGPNVARLGGGRTGVARALQDEPEIAIITYQLLPNVSDLLRAWARRGRTHIVLDESHRVKSGVGVYAREALELASVATRRDILSGTPLPHAAEDLRPQFDFLWPGQRILPDLRIASEAPPEVLEDVERRVRQLYVRTRKDELHLPPLDVRPVAVQLGPLQRELYEVLRSEAARAASGMSSLDRRFFRVLGRHVVRLIQAATNPMLLTQGELVEEHEIEPSPEGVRAWELMRELARYEQPAKIQRTVELVRRSVERGDRVLVWTSFVMNLTSLERLLTEYNPVLLYGQVPTGAEDDPETREGRIRRFHDDPECRVMIANPAAAGEGISLHRACNYAIYLDRTFNAAHYMQSVDRIHRLGSAEPARIDVLQARGTIDGRVAERLHAKIEAMSVILNDDGLRALVYDPEDAVDEFEAGIQYDDIEQVVEHLAAGRGDD